MPETANLSLPLVQPAQAQKHITVNASLARLDTLTMLKLESIDVSAPPVEAPQGTAWSVATPASGDWSGQSGRIAFATNGGWEFVTPARGWRGFVVDRSSDAVWDGSEWLPDTLALSAGGAQTRCSILESDVAISPGSETVTGVVIPSNAIVLGVTARVLAALGGTLESWRLGVAEDPSRFGTGLGRSVGSFALGVGSTPTAYYSSTPVLMGAIGGDFDTGIVRIAVHMMSLVPPR